MIMHTARNKQNVFDFLAWFCGHEIQAEFGNTVESMLGRSARYGTANILAFENLSWSEAEKEVLRLQWEQVTNRPIIPGHYYVDRNMLFALRRVIYFNNNPRETLLRYNNNINKEITRRRIEFGLE